MIDFDDDPGLQNNLPADPSMPETGSQQTDLGTVWESFQFDPTAIPLPWDAEGNIEASSDVAGTPAADVCYWQLQTTGFTCAVVAQRGIIEAFTGESVSETQLVYEATANGWLTGDGMSPADVGNLLEVHNIPCHQQMGATVENLIAELSQGHKVIVGVDSGEMWNQDSPLEDFFHQAADHAIWVTGVDMSDPNNPKVFINDSGDPDGAGKAYDLAVFVDAWQDSGFFYVATDQAPPDYHLVADGFDPTQSLFTDLVGYFGKLFDDFQQQLGTDTPADDGLIQPLSAQPVAELDEAQQNDLFRTL